MLACRACVLLAELLLPAASAFMLSAPPRCRTRSCGHQLPACHSLQMLETDTPGYSVYDEFLLTDEASGERRRIGLAEKEKLYLDALECTYFDMGEVCMPDDEFDQLKLDFEFEGSQVTTFSSQEIKFLLANKNYRLGKPTMDDKEYDALRRTLKGAGSVVVLHDAPTCKVDTGVCKMDARVDQGKQRLLYLPGTAAGLILGCELCFWTLHTDPLLSILLSAVPSYFFGVWFTENVFAQKPLVVNAPCPDCNYLLTIYFGDLFSVETDSKGAAPSDDVDFVCAQCKSPLKANRESMLVQTLPKKI